jgi:hypothetical protein
MNTITTTELDYTAYLERQLQAITPESVVEQAWKVRASGNFRFINGSWTPQEYKGFAVVSMVDNNPGNAIFQGQLAALQQELISRLDQPSVYYPLPVESFHQTVANTLSDHRFKQQLVATGKLPSFPQIVADTFTAMPVAPGSHPVSMRMVGFSVFGSSIGLLGVIDDPADYARILQFREQIYGNAALAALDVKRTRPFIGHVTLLYVEQTLDVAGRQQLAEVVNTLNQELPSLTFQLSHATLCYYDDLSLFQPVKNVPEIKL